MIKLTPSQNLFVLSFPQWFTGSNTIAILCGDGGSGKAQPLDEPVLTPTGFKTMQEIQVGDFVISEEGKPIQVLQTFEHEELSMYELTFSDGSYTRCCEDHLWKVQSKSNREDGIFRVLPLSKLLEGINKERKGKLSYVWSVPLTKPVEFKEQEYKIAPYSMGYILGNGSSGISSLTVTIGVADYEEILNMFQPNEILSHKIKEASVAILAICFPCREYYDSLGLNKVKSVDKFIPSKYLLGSLKQRKELLAGLLDSDGSCVKNKATFSSSSYRLVEDFCWLVRSLGGTATANKQNRGLEWNVCFRTPFNPFKLQRKAASYFVRPIDVLGNKRIVSAKSLGILKGKCLLVDSKEHLYLTKDFTVTHNTTVLKKALEKQPFHHFKKKALILAETNEAVFVLMESLGTGYEHIKTVCSAFNLVHSVNEEGVEGLLQHREPEFEGITLLVWDECFTPETEVLTPEGFVAFKDLKDGTPVASMNLETEKVTFNVPLRNIIKDYKGELRSLQTPSAVSIEVTLNHDWVVREARTKKLVKVPFESIKYNDKLLCTATSGMKGKLVLTDQERLCIAFQADGSYQNWKGALSYTGRKGICDSSNTSISFAFSKARKLKRLYALLDRLELRYSSGQPDKIGRIQIRIYDVPTSWISKDLTERFSLAEVSQDYAKSFIEELIQWDGHIAPKNWYYSSTVKVNTDFAQAMAILAGYRTNVTTQEDNRKESYKTVYRLFIRWEVETGTFANLKPKIQYKEYEGKVYCVETIDGTVIVRDKGLVHVSGNCSMASSNRLKMVLDLCKQYGIYVLLIGDHKQLPSPEDETTWNSRCDSVAFQLDNTYEYFIGEDVATNKEQWVSEQIFKQTFHAKKVEEARRRVAKLNWYEANGFQVPVRFTLTENKRSSNEHYEFCTKVGSLQEEGKLGFVSDKYMTPFSTLKKYLQTQEGKNNFLNGDTVVLAYTNKRVAELNQLVRKELFGNESEDPFIVSDRLIFRQPTKCFDKPIKDETYSFEVLTSQKGTIFTTNTKAVVKKVGYKTILGITVVELNIHSNHFVKGLQDGFIYIPLERSEAVEKFNKMRQQATFTKGDKERKKMFEKCRMFCSIFNVGINPFKEEDSRRDTKHGYSISIHNSQGSSIKDVFVDEANLATIKNKHLKYKLAYVAYSRCVNYLARLI